MSNKRELVYPAIYKHFKHTEDGILNNYMYVTMGISKPLEDYDNELQKTMSAMKDILVVNLTESNDQIVVFEKEQCYYHKFKDYNSELVIYKSLYNNHIAYAKPLDMFLSEVDKEKYPNVDQKYRFELVGILGRKLS
ncbi:DUF1653 domain-containing protein [Clostridium botulinum]|uniref:DUF1653 domain-containing protein n=1 Tax=Clostridium botulinum TaxID=1491 RepID=UPI001E492797|nr:DUF1653 domain-containing protein [Clostridium botulinum]MCD3329316.1 DUF1653 domain-containing protein [Clostridium botulinum D/C]MCD3344535.1 DUF1653 domain-containing protein [Clostridium botulinum D/C]MCD3353015.1 DUF1653 domain-containing protein [Clostridium botulinum D/C]